jgi:Secretion system C-terminal sorting domain
LSSRLVSAPLNWQKVKCSIMMGESYRIFLLAKSRRSGILNGVNSANNLATVTYPCDGLVNTEGVYENIKAFVVFPNPTTEEVMVSFYLTKNAPVSLSVMNTLGQVLSTKIVDSTFGLNEYPLSIKGENGVYFVQIKVENEVIVRKVIKFAP